MNNNCRLLWITKESLIANHLTRPLSDVSLTNYSEVLRMLALYCQSARVVVKVVEPTLQFVSAFKDMVVVVS